MGHESIKRRPELAEAFALAEREGAIVVCHDFSRISRHTATATKLVRESKIAVYEACTGDKMSGLVLQSVAARAEAEGKAIGARVKKRLGELKAQGVKLGNRTNLPDAQKAGADSNARRAISKAEAIADILEASPNQDALTASEIAKLLNSSGCLSGRQKPWTVSGVRRPLMAARKIIQEREVQEMKKDPMFGMF